MNRLFLLRHAKSSWDDPALPDRERPLAPRGHRAMSFMAAHLGSEGVAPALVLCSPARRAQETLGGILELLGDDVSVSTEEELYGASTDDLLERLHKIPDEVPSAMLIGHNPAVEQLALTLARGDARRADLELKYPTGALATFDVTSDWDALSGSSATLVSFVRPKDLRRAG